MILKRLGTLVLQAYGGLIITIGNEVTVKIQGSRHGKKLVIIAPKEMEIRQWILDQSGTLIKKPKKRDEHTQGN